MHEIHCATPVDPAHARMFCQVVELMRWQCYIDYAVELTEIMMQGLADGKDSGAAGLGVVLYVCLCYSQLSVLAGRRRPMPL